MGAKSIAVPLTECWGPLFDSPCENIFLRKPIGCIYQMLLHVHTQFLRSGMQPETVGLPSM